MSKDMNESCVYEYYAQDDTNLIDYPHHKGTGDFENFIKEEWGYCPYCGKSILLVYRNDDPVKEEKPLSFAGCPISIVYNGIPDNYPQWGFASKEQAEKLLRIIMQKLDIK